MLPYILMDLPIFTVQHGCPIIQGPESFRLEKLYSRLNDICGVLQLYDPAQGLQHNVCFFLVTKNGKSANKRGGPVS